MKHANHYTSPWTWALAWFGLVSGVALALEWPWLVWVAVLVTGYLLAGIVKALDMDGESND